MILKRIKRGICEMIAQKISMMAMIGSIVGIVMSVFYVIMLGAKSFSPLTLHEISTSILNLALRIFVMTSLIGTAILLGMTILLLISGLINSFTKN